MINFTIEKHDDRAYYDDDTGCTNESYTMVADGIDVASATIEAYDDGMTLLARIDVEEQYRGNGFGTKFIDYLREAYGSLIVVPDNSRAAKLYERLGESTEGTSAYNDSYFALDEGYGVYKI